MEYTNNVRELRLKKKLKQSEAAAAAGIGQGEWSRIESGRRTFEPHRDKIAKSLGVSPAKVTQLVKQDGEPVMAGELPVYGFPVPNSDAFDFTKKMMSKVDCPPEMIGVDGAYAAFCYGNQLAPRINNGDLAFVCPLIPAKLGALCVIKWQAGDRIFGRIVEFVSSDGKTCVGKTLAPAEEVEFDDVIAIDVVRQVKFDL